MIKRTSILDLVENEDYVAIEHGRLIVRFNDGSEAPQAWMDEYGPRMTVEILRLTNVAACIYQEHSTGLYKVTATTLSEGLTINFLDPVPGSMPYTIFNVDLKRKTTTRYGGKGSMLPKGHFSARKKSKLAIFWRVNNLPIPRRPSELHTQIRKMANLLFSYQIAPHFRPDTGILPLSDKNKINKDSLLILNISYLDIQQGLLFEKHGGFF